MKKFRHQRIGEQHYHWTIIAVDLNCKNHVICRCVCGKVRSVSVTALTTKIRRNQSRSCCRWEDSLRKHNGNEAWLTLGGPGNCTE